MCNPSMNDAAAAGPNAAVEAAKWQRADVEVEEKKSALRRMAPRILVGYLFNTLLYLVLAHGPLLPPNLAAASRYCPTTTSDAGAGGPSCSRRDLLAFQVVSFLNLSFLGLVGVHAFFVSRRPSRALPRTPQGRILLGGTLPEADAINAAIVVFQGWDFVMSCLFEEHRTAVMLAHHFLAFLCGYFCLVYEVLPYYAVYFGGVCEFSSIFLCVLDFFQVHPPSSLAPPYTSLSVMLPMIETVSQVTFVVTFFAFRIVGWTYMSYMFITDASYVMRNGLLKMYRPGSGWFLWYMMTTAGVLGALQVYWFKAILNKVSEILE